MKYLTLKDGTAELRDADGLLELDTYQTCDALRRKFGVEGRGASVLSIGPAGEHHVRWAGVFVDHGHSASHNGAGPASSPPLLRLVGQLLPVHGPFVEEPEEGEEPPHVAASGRRIPAAVPFHRVDVG